VKQHLVLFIYLLCVKCLFAQLRTFDVIFPDISEDIKAAAFSSSSYTTSGQKSAGFKLIGNSGNTALNPQIINLILNKNPRFLLETIFVISGKPGAVDLLDIYNALGKIQSINNVKYSNNPQKKEPPVFENVTRIISEKQTTPISDPPPSSILPYLEIMYIKLKDINFGNSYYRSQIMPIQSGLSYTLTNFKNISFLFIPVIREEKFIAQLYIEPINEGILFYIIAGADISDFLTSRINIDAAISKRLSVFISWAVDGIIEQISRKTTQYE
jgi:hypothetical protein